VDAAGQKRVDHLGSVRATVNDVGEVVSYDDYDAWGLILNGRSMTAQANLPNKFTGKEWDDDFGLNWNYFGARYYDPVIGRFIMVDPLAAEFAAWSPYNYVLDNPTLLMDPTGRAPEDDEVDGRSGISIRATQRSFLGALANLFNTTSEAAKGTPEFVANGAANTAQDVKAAASELGESTVDAGIVISDAVSEGSTAGAIAGLAGIVVGVLTKNPALATAATEFTGTMLSIGIGADISSTVFKGADAAFFDGSANAFLQQGLETGINAASGKFLNKTAASLVRTNIAGRFFNPGSGRFVSNRIGFTTTAIRDATKVVISFGQ